MKERNNSYKVGSKNSWSKPQLANFVKVYNRRHRIFYFVNAMFDERHLHATIVIEMKNCLAKIKEKIMCGRKVKREFWTPCT